MIKTLNGEANYGDLVAWEYSSILFVLTTANALRSIGINLGTPCNEGAVTTCIIIAKPEKFDPVRAQHSNYREWVKAYRGILTWRHMLGDTPSEYQFVTFTSVEDSPRIAISPYLGRFEFNGAAYVQPLDEDVNLYSIEKVRPYIDLYCTILPGSTPDCLHEWKEYTGLVEQFIYCTKCNVKKGN